MTLQPPLALWLQYIERSVGFVLPSTQHRWLINAVMMVADRECIDPQVLYDSLDSSDRLKQRLIDEVLIAESRFFRDEVAAGFIADQYQKLAKQGVVKKDKPFLVTSVGCSTGQEVWSIAMALLDVKQTAIQTPFAVVGVDASIKSLEMAIKAEYSPKSHLEIPDRYRQYIDKKDGHWQPIETLRSYVGFDVCNVFDDNAFEAFLSKQKTLSSVVICQNTLIYFRKFDQRDILARLERLLKPQGYLILGAGEGLFWQSDTLQKIAHPLINLWQKKQNLGT